MGSAGSAEKVEWLTGELGFDAAFNYKEVDLDEALREHCPKGIDIYFDNVGGDHLAAALARMRVHGRIPLCGAISQYNEEAPPPGPDNFLSVLPNRLTIRGFIVLDHFGLLPAVPGARSGPLGAERRAASYRETDRGRDREHARGLHGPARGREHRQDARARRARPGVAQRLLRRRWRPRGGLPPRCSPR